MKKISLTTAVAIALSCGLLCMPTLADYNYDGWPVETRLNGTVNGGVFIAYEPWDGTTNLTLTAEVPNGTVKWARLYVGAWGGTEYDQGWVNVTFNGFYDRNGLGPIHLQGEDDTNPNVWCSGHGKHWLYYDVTELVNAGSKNTATAKKINETSGYFDGRVYGIVLVAVYEGGDDPKDIQYWINEGSDGLNYNTDHDEGTTYFEDLEDTDRVTNAELTMVHLTAYSPPCSDCLTFNSNSLDTSMIDSDAPDADPYFFDRLAEINRKIDKHRSGLWFKLKRWVVGWFR